jgi:protein O-mannosyl-transferase
MGRNIKKKRASKGRDPRPGGNSVKEGYDPSAAAGNVLSRPQLSSWQPSPAENFYLAVAICGFLIMAVVLVFGQTVRYDFVNYDDNEYVYNNPHVINGLTAKGITWAFTTNHVSNWHPLTWLSHMLDCQLYALEPGGHHLTNVVLHTVTAILLFLVLRRMTGDLWPSAFVAVVFAIHPLRAESVAWVSERKDIMSGLFLMLTIGAYVEYVRHPFSLIRYLLIMAFFTLGLMSKPTLVTLPFVLLLLDYWPLGRLVFGENEKQPVSGPWPVGRFSILTRLLVEKSPLFALSFVSCALTIWVQDEALALNMPLSLRIGNAAVSYIAYIGQLFYPVGLALLYPHPGFNLPMWKITGAILALVAVSGCVFAWRRRYPFLLVGWLWYLGMLIPMIGLVQVGIQAMADRYTYLTQVGLYIAIGWGAMHVTKTWLNRGLVCGVTAILIVALLMGCAWQQTTYWHDSETLWTRTLICTSRNFMAHNNLGFALVQAGQPQEAIVHYEKSLKINPDYSEAHFNMGCALVQVGRFDDAIMYLHEALRLKPNYPNVYNNLGNIMLSQGHLKEAIDNYQKALQLNPGYEKAHNNLGKALIQIGQPQEAIIHLKQALQLNPDYINAYNNLALAYVKTHQSSEAVAAAQKAIKLAESQRQIELAKKIEDWLNSYRASMQTPQNSRQID